MKELTIIETKKAIATPMAANIPKFLSIAIGLETSDRNPTAVVIVVKRHGMNTYDKFLFNLSCSKEVLS